MNLRNKKWTPFERFWKTGQSMKTRNIHFTRLQKVKMSNKYRKDLILRQKYKTWKKTKKDEKRENKYFMKKCKNIIWAALKAN